MNYSEEKMKITFKNNIHKSNLYKSLQKNTYSKNSSEFIGITPYL